MAQFRCPELGGSGQWMRGGMTMVGDMFNTSLKSKVEGLCSDLSNLVAQRPFVPLPATHADPQNTSGQHQTQGGGGYSGNWWPADLGSPNSSGGQNGVRYAYFGNARRLAIEMNGQVTLYDTLNHQISGVSQQQGSTTSLTFSSQNGSVNVADLPLLSTGSAQTPRAST